MVKKYKKDVAKSNGTSAVIKENQRDIIQTANRLLYGVQKVRIAVGNRIDDRNRNKISVPEEVVDLYGMTQELEVYTQRIMTETMKHIPIWTEYLVNVRGIGPKLASSLLAEIVDISRFTTVSKLWAYGALTAEYVVAECTKGHKMIMSSDKRVTCPVLKMDKGVLTECNASVKITEYVKGKAPKRKQGYHYLFNTRLQVTAWKICSQFLKQGDVKYKNIYYNEKKRLQVVRSELTPMEIHNRAMRKMVKIFIQHLWVKWRELEGLPVTLPYVHDKLGHTSYIAP